MPTTIVAADWSKFPEKRAVWLADVRGRCIFPAPGAAWDLAAVLMLARQRTQEGSVLVSLDLVLGVPKGYWQEITGITPWRDAKCFVDLLLPLSDGASFWKEVSSASEWTVTRPFFSVPKGVGAMKAFTYRAGYELVRAIDTRCRAKPPFCVSGIPGTVGSGTREFWRELCPLVKSERDFSVWPFDGRLPVLLRGGGIVLAELYPAIAYTAALREELPGRLLKVAKTRPLQRERAMELLAKAEWVSRHSVTVSWDEAAETEDDFDAAISAAGLLRCVLEGIPLAEPEWEDPIAEGGILLTSAIDFNQRSTTLKTSERTGVGGARVESNEQQFGRRNGSQTTDRDLRIQDGSSRSDYLTQCPIEGCAKVFRRGVIGWDGHVASLRTHPQWHPEVTDPTERENLFKSEFASWAGWRKDR